MNKQKIYGFENADSNQIPPPPEVIMKKPWIYIDMSKTKFSPFRFLIGLCVIADLIIIGFTTAALIAMLNTPQWPNAGVAYGGLLSVEVLVLFCLFAAYGMSTMDMF
jgi:hypothetical protein